MARHDPTLVRVLPGETIQRSYWICTRRRCTSRCACASDLLVEDIDAPLRRHPQGGMWSSTASLDFVENNPGGARPSALPASASWSADYFVVVRTDSGPTGRVAEARGQHGHHLRRGHKAFIEPRRFSGLPARPGIFADSQLPAQGIPSAAASISPWQDDPR